MNSDPLDDLLAAYSRRPVPQPFARLKDEVWRTIRQRPSLSFWARIFPLEDWRERFSEPRLVAAALAVALIAGLLPVTAAQSFAHSRLARTSLHLEVFSPMAIRVLSRPVL